MLLRHLVPAVILLGAVVSWACEDHSQIPSSPTPTTTEPNPPTPAPPPSQPVTPTHTLTITASSSCTSLPAVATKRTYPAQVLEQADGEIVVWVVNSTDIMVGWANDDGFTGTRTGDIVRFTITDDLFAPYAMIERIAGLGDMGFSGTASGTIDGNGNILAVFDGVYRLGYGQGPVLCTAPDHRLEVTRVLTPAALPAGRGGASADRSAPAPTRGDRPRAASA